jgi:hypothetical protein
MLTGDIATATARSGPSRSAATFTLRYAAPTKKLAADDANRVQPQRHRCTAGLLVLD